MNYKNRIIYQLLIEKIEAREAFLSEGLKGLGKDNLFKNYR